MRSRVGRLLMLGSLFITGQNESPISFLKTIHQSLILRDKLGASWYSVILDFEKSEYQFSESFHDFLQIERSEYIAIMPKTVQE
jgi:hypothetical protein